MTEMAPTPYTAEQIKEACPEGRQDTFRMEQLEQKPVLRQTWFLAHTSDGVTVRSEVVDAEGMTIGEANESVSTWEDLRKHAAYPKANTTIAPATVETPAGVFEAKLYVVRTTTDNGESQTTRAWFANTLPGPPVLMESEVDGMKVFSMELVSHLNTPPE